MAKTTTSTTSASTATAAGTPTAADRPGSTNPPSMSAPIGGPGSDPDSVTGWMNEGNCRMYAPATFFPSDGVGVDKARKICATCPVIETCLDYALTERIEHGVWGGCSERERRRILKRRQLDVAAS